MAADARGLRAFYRAVREYITMERLLIETRNDLPDLLLNVIPEHIFRLAKLTVHAPPSTKSRGCGFHDYEPPTVCRNFNDPPRNRIDPSSTDLRNSGYYRRERHGLFYFINKETVSLFACLRCKQQHEERKFRTKEIYRFARTADRDAKRSRNGTRWDERQREKITVSFVLFGDSR